MNPSIPLTATKKAAPSRQREKAARPTGRNFTISKARRHIKISLMGFLFVAWIFALAAVLDGVLHEVIAILFGGLAR